MLQGLPENLKKSAQLNCINNWKESYKNTVQIIGIEQQIEKGVLI